MMEALESRTLMAAVPAGYAAGYATLLHDNAVLLADAHQFTATFTADKKTLTADVKALPASKTNQKFLKEAEVAAAAVANSAIAGANDFIRAADPAYRRFAAAGEAFHLKPNLANGHKFVAAINAINAVSMYNYAAPIQTIIAKGINLEETLQAELSGLAAANPTAQPLDTDVQKDQTQITALPPVLTNEEAVIDADITAFQQTNLTA